MEEKQKIHTGASGYKEAAVTPWISTEVKLPFLESLVLATLNDGSVSTARLTRVDCEYCWEFDAIFGRYLGCLDEVLYWMPIPELPEGGGNV